MDNSTPSSSVNAQFIAQKALNTARSAEEGVATINSRRAAASGFAPLDGSSLVPAAYLPTGSILNRTLTLTPDAALGEGVEIIEGPAANYPVIRPKSNAGSTDVPLFIQALGAARVSIDGDYVLHEGEFTTLGGILVGTGAGTFVELTPGADGDVLTADSGDPSGLSWAAGGGGGGLSQAQVLARQSFGGF